MRSQNTVLQQHFPQSLRFPCQNISERTIRDTYWTLRQKLYDAVFADKNLFGGAGEFIFSHGRVKYQGTLLMEAVVDSDTFGALVNLQSPGNHPSTEEQAQLLMFELAIRTLCKTPGIPRKLSKASEPVVQFYQEVLAMIDEIERVQNDLANRWKTGILKIELEHKLMELDLLKAQHDIGAVTEDHRMSIDPLHMIYSNLRTFLARNPL
ncbi:MAG: hypothetical protein ABJM43_19035 [Paracoccaceae bacterium]